MQIHTLENRREGEREGRSGQLNRGVGIHIQSMERREETKREGERVMENEKKNKRMRRSSGGHCKGAGGLKIHSTDWRRMTLISLLYSIQANVNSPYINLTEQNPE